MTKGVRLPPDLEFRSFEYRCSINLQTVCDSWTDEMVAGWEAQSKAVDEVNKATWTHNNDVERAWTAFFVAKGYKNKSSLKKVMEMLGKPTYFPSSGNVWENQTLLIDGKQFSPYQIVGFSPYTLTDVVKKYRDRKAYLEKCEKGSETLRLKLVSMAPEFGLSASSFDSMDTFLAAVDEKAREKWISENFPDGTVLNLNGCSECNMWTVGDHRCSCGNRRVYLGIEGDVLSGFYAFPECY